MGSESGNDGTNGNAEDRTTIKIKRSTWEELHGMKDEPGVTYDDVIQRLLECDKPDSDV